LLIDRFSEKEFEIENGSDAAFLIKTLNLNIDQVTIIIINGRHADYKTIIHDGDEVAFFPPVGGG